MCVASDVDVAKFDAQTFLDSSYAAKHPDDAEQVEQLRIAIADYVHAISDALGVHRSLCRDVAFHEALRSRQYIVSV